MRVTLIRILPSTINELIVMEGIWDVHIGCYNNNSCFCRMFARYQVL